ncbi:MAG: YraN family protein [Sulfitobacter sp.]
MNGRIDHEEKVSTPARTRARRGARAYYTGRAAESSIAQDYARRGFPLACERWRGKSGEIDLILRDGDGIIFVEVKQSCSIAEAASHLRPRQVQRLWSAAEEYLTQTPRGSFTEVRFDVALVDAQGQFEIMENAFA